MRYVADDKISGMRIDKAVPEIAGEVSRARAQKMVDGGLIFVNGEPCLSKKYAVSSGDVIEFDMPEPAADAAPVPEGIPLHIIYEDDDLIVVNKPCGMVVHPAPGSEHGTLVNALLAHTGGKLSRLNGEDRPGIVHRIDKDTSGLIVAAKTDRAFTGLSAQFAEHTITRRYHALVLGNFRQDEGTVDMPIGRDPKDRKRRAVCGEAARDAVTHFRVLERFGDITYVECRLETGRTHQIRVHMAYIKHPLLGDPVYGPRKARKAADGQYLHAAVLGFVHPVSGEYVEFSTDPPDRFIKKLAALRAAR